MPYRTAPKQTVRLAVRTLLIVTASLAAVAASFAFAAYKLTSAAPGYAFDRMRYVATTVNQESAFLYRGSCNQPVLRIVVKTTGSCNPLTVQSVSFSTAGTSMPVSAQVCNARLYYTAGDSVFSIDNPCGSTMPEIRSGESQLTVHQPLAEGLNYFWLAFDILPHAGAYGRVDAECNYIRIGTDRKLPETVSPPGFARIESNVPYYSTGLPDFDGTGAWNSRRDGSGHAPASANERRIFYVQSGHRLQCVRAVGGDVVYVERGGTLCIDADVHVRNLIVADHGVLECDGGNGDRVGLLDLRHGATLFHNHPGKVIGLRHRFEPGSTVCFYRQPETAAGSMQPGDRATVRPSEKAVPPKDELATVAHSQSPAGPQPGDTRIAASTAGDGKTISLLE